MKLCHVDRNGFLLLTRQHRVAYWTPWAWQPLSIRTDSRGRRGWWGALVVEHRELVLMPRPLRRLWLRRRRQRRCLHAWRPDPPGWCCMWCDTPAPPGFTPGINYEGEGLA